MHSLVPSKRKVRCFPITITNRKYCSIVTKLVIKENAINMGLFICLTDQVAAKLCIPKVVFNICDACKMKSDEFFLYLTVHHRNRTLIQHNLSLLTNYNRYCLFFLTFLLSFLSVDLNITNAYASI